MVTLHSEHFRCFTVRIIFEYNKSYKFHQNNACLFPCNTRWLSLHFGGRGSVGFCLFVFLFSIFLGQTWERKRSPNCSSGYFLQPDTDSFIYIGQDSVLYPMLSRRFVSMVHTLQNAVSALLIYNDNTLMLKLHCVLAAAFYLALSYKQPRGRTFIHICKAPIAANINKSYHLGAVTYTLFNL